MIIKPMLTHLFKSLQSHGRKACNTRKWYTDYKVPLINLTGRFYPHKVSQMCTSENYYPSAVNDNSWGIIRHYYKVNNLALLKTQYKIIMLQRQHDPKFNIESFKKGTKQAISVITKSLHENKSTDSYLSLDASKELERISHTWGEKVRKHIALEPSQIRQILILKVNDFKETDAIVYQIITFVAGYKQIGDSLLLEILIEARFERLYSEFEKPEWIVTNFNLKKMAILST